MTYYVHTSNAGWLQHPDLFAHIAKALGVAVLVQSDLALADHEYRIYDDAGPVTRTQAIGEDCGRRIRRAIETHLATPRVDKPAPIVEPARVVALRQATLF